MPEGGGGIPIGGGGGGAWGVGGGSGTTLAEFIAGDYGGGATRPRGGPFTDPKRSALDVIRYSLLKRSPDPARPQGPAGPPRVQPGMQPADYLQLLLQIYEQLFGPKPAMAGPAVNVFYPPTPPAPVAGPTPTGTGDVTSQGGVMPYPSWTAESGLDLGGIIGDVTDWASEQLKGWLGGGNGVGEVVFPSVPVPVPGRLPVPTAPPGNGNGARAGALSVQSPYRRSTGAALRATPQPFVTANPVSGKTQWFVPARVRGFVMTHVPKPRRRCACRKR